MPPTGKPPLCRQCGKKRTPWNSARKRWAYTCGKQCRLDERRAANTRFMKRPPVWKAAMSERAVAEMVEAWARK